MNKVYLGDAVEWLKDIEDNSIQLVYIDPPFYSDQIYSRVHDNECMSFTDKFDSIESYIEFLRPICKELHRVLKSTGNFLLHCNYYASHRIRCMLDDVFGTSNFVNEIIWCYSRPGNGTAKMFNKCHQNIYYYAKEKGQQVFNHDDIREPYAVGAAHSPRHGMGGIFKGHAPVSSHPKGKLALDWCTIPPPSPAGGPSRSCDYRIPNNPKGKLALDWCYINSMRGRTIEYQSYPTQKPEKLLRKFISGLSNIEDTVLDCFVGSGTTAKVASDLQRNFIVGDISPVAVRKTAQRLYDTAFCHYEIVNGYNEWDMWDQMDDVSFKKNIANYMGWIERDGEYFIPDQNELAHVIIFPPSSGRLTHVAIEAIRACSRRIDYLAVWYNGGELQGYNKIIYLTKRLKPLFNEKQYKLFNAL